MSKTYKIRFHLARGENYQRWQIKTQDSVSYHDPEDVCIEMRNATLKNSRKTAERIHCGENKTVCAWVECDDVVVRAASYEAVPDPDGFLYYNPRKLPHWHDADRNDVDGKTFPVLVTMGRLVLKAKQ